MAVSRGKVFETELKKSLEAEGFAVLRIADKLYWNGTRMASDTTPADFVAAYPGEGLHAFVIEAKAVNGKSLPFDRLQEHQHDALAAFDPIHENAHGYVAVCYYDKDNVRRFNECYMVPVSVWDELRDGSGRKSLPILTCVDDERIVRCPRAKGSTYDMSGFAKLFR